MGTNPIKSADTPHPSARSIEEEIQGAPSLSSPSSSWSFRCSVPGRGWDGIGGRGGIGGMGGRGGGAGIGRFAGSKPPRGFGG
eukprot:1190355-Prorocentrum_minimum.AAC.7